MHYSRLLIAATCPENSDLTEASTTTNFESQPALVEAHGHGPSGGEETLNASQSVAENVVADGIHEPQESNIKAPSTEVAPASMAGHASHAVEADGDAVGVDSAVVVRVLLEAAQKISNASVTSPSGVARGSQSGNDTKPAVIEGDAADEDRQSSAQRRQRVSVPHSVPRVDD